MIIYYHILCCPQDQPMMNLRTILPLLPIFNLSRALSRCALFLFHHMYVVCMPKCSVFTPRTTRTVTKYVDPVVTLTKTAGNFLNGIVALSEILQTSVQLYLVISASTSGLPIIIFCSEAVIYLFFFF